MKKNLKLFIFFALTLGVPLSVHAQGPSSIRVFLEQLTGIFGNVIPLIIALAILAFFWGLAKLVLHAGNEDKRSEGKRIMIWGIIALFVILSLWGIIALISQTFFGSGDPGYSLLP
ncbi:hypothetical protein IIB51_02945 [Patescibacteria group bacterium]|nr:hypothetical protein [Patescibacteria group bacterium]MCH8889344.1 hypothetical protein [Patescibacteria group bacterium]